MTEREIEGMTKRQNEKKTENPGHKASMVKMIDTINGNLKMNCRISIYIYKVAH